MTNAIEKELRRAAQRYLTSPNPAAGLPYLHLITASDGKFTTEPISTSNHLFTEGADPCVVINSFAEMMSTERGQVIASSLLGDDLVGVMFTIAAVSSPSASANILAMHSPEHYAFAGCLIGDAELFMVRNLTSGTCEMREPDEEPYTSLMEAVVSLMYAMDDARNAPVTEETVRAAHDMMTRQDPMVSASAAALIADRVGRASTHRKLAQGIGTRTDSMLTDLVVHSRVR